MVTAFEDVPLFDDPPQTDPPFGHYYDNQGRCPCGKTEDQ